MTKPQIKFISYTLGIIIGFGCLITAVFWTPMTIALGVIVMGLLLVGLAVGIFKACKRLLADWIYAYRLRGCLHSPTDTLYFEMWEHKIEAGKFEELRENLRCAQADNNMHPMAKADRLKLIDRLEKVKRPFTK